MTVSRYPDHLMLGPGGRLIVPKSESLVLAEIVRQARTLRDTAETSAVRHIAASIMGMAGTLERQAGAGYHRNPASQKPKMGSVLVGPMVVHRVMSRNVHDIRYTHATDGDDYEHVFERPTLALAIERGGYRDVLLTAPDGAPIWEDF